MTTTKPIAQITPEDTIVILEDNENHPLYIVNRVYDDGERVVFWVQRDEGDPYKKGYAKSDSVITLDENEAFCPKGHGVVSITDSGRNPGFCAGYVYWTNYSCGCQDMDDNSYLES